MELNTTLFKLLLIFTALGFVISLFTGAAVSRVVLRPISRIIATTRKITADNLDTRIETWEAKDELYELSETINGMTARIQSSFEKQEQLISDVSHELKTPISVIKGYVSLLERWGKDNPEVMEEAIARIDREASNMSGIVDDLLFLAREDNGTLSLDKISFDVSELVSEVIEDTRAAAPCDIFAPQNDSCMYFGDYRLLKQLFRILIDNSIKYSESEFKIEIRSEKTEDALQISVKDSGIGIPSDEIDKIFDRFYRADKARTRGSGGTGLGLSIAKAIVDSHGGKIAAGSELSRGTEIKIELPL